MDSSTQSTKVEARDLDTGRVVGIGRAPHPATHPPVSEQDPLAWWDALVAAVHALGDQRRDVGAIAVGGQQHGLVVLDAADAVLRPAKLWNDTTSAPQAEALVAAQGATWWAATCGSVPVAAFTVTKVAWLAEHEPDVHGAIARIMLPHDYLTWRLTGEHVTDRGDASGTGWWSPEGYRPEVLELVGLTPVMLPRVVDPWSVAGHLQPAAAAALGLPAGIPVGPGSGDNMAAALGLGLAPGDLAVSLGTSGTVYAVSATPTADPAGAVAGFADASGAYLPLVCTLNATKVTDTVAGWLGTDPAGLAALALGADPAAGGDGEGPVLVPFFDGERTPNLPEASGLWTGLRPGTTREQLALAAHDGVVCGLLDGVDALVAAGVDVGGRLHLVGGGARSAAYRQRVADLAGRDVFVPDSDETVATGACVQAAVVAAAGDPAAVIERWALRTGATTAARAVDHHAIRRRYGRARALVSG